MSCQIYFVRNTDLVFHTILSTLTVILAALTSDYLVYPEQFMLEPIIYMLFVHWNRFSAFWLRSKEYLANAFGLAGGLGSHGGSPNQGAADIRRSSGCIGPQSF